MPAEGRHAPRTASRQTSRRHHNQALARHHPQPPAATTQAKHGEPLAHGKARGGCRRRDVKHTPGPPGLTRGGSAVQQRWSGRGGAGLHGGTAPRPRTAGERQHRGERPERVAEVPADPRPAPRRRKPPAPRGRAPRRAGGVGAELRGAPGAAAASGCLAVQGERTGGPREAAPHDLAAEGNQPGGRGRTGWRWNSTDVQTPTTRP